VATNARGGVLLLSSSYPSPTARTRGAFVEDIAHGLRERWPVTAVAPLIYPDDPRAETRNGIPVTRFEFGSRGVLLKEYGGTPILLMLRYMFRGLLATIGQARRQRVIFAHWVVPAGVIGAAASWLTGRPLAVYAHGSDINVYADKSALYRALTRFVLRRARHVFAVSEPIRERLATRWGVPQERLSLIPCGVDTATFFPAEAPPEGPPRVIFVGDLVPAKGVPELVEAALALAAEGLDFTLEIIGDGPLRESLAGRVEEAGVNTAVSLSGPLPRGEVAARMRAAHLLVLPSHNEGTPVCVMEALSSGTPVIATRVGGIPDLVEHDTDGVLVPARDVPVLTHALRRLICHPEELARLRDGAVQVGERFSLIHRRAEVTEALARAFPELG